MTETVITLGGPVAVQSAEHKAQLLADAERLAAAATPKRSIMERAKAAIAPTPQPADTKVAEMQGQIDALRSSLDDALQRLSSIEQAPVASPAPPQDPLPLMREQPPAPEPEFAPIVAAPPADPIPEPAAVEPPSPPKRGMWQRVKSYFGA